MIYKTQNFFSKVYHYSIALTRRQSGSVAMGFAFAVVNYMFQFILMMSIMIILRGSLNVRLRGEFGLYILTGVGLFLIHNKIIGDLATPQQDKQLMPLLAISPSIMIMGQLLHTIYMHTLIMLVMAAGMWVYYGGFEIDAPFKVFWIYMLCIGWSVSMGLCLHAIVPVWPGLFQKVVMVYKRLGIVTSGKMIPGNMMSGKFSGIFIWNPLYHCIDQMRGAVFPNYTPFNSNLAYPMKATLIASVAAVLLYVGLKRFR